MHEHQLSIFANNSAYESLFKKALDINNDFKYIPCNYPDEFITQIIICDYTPQQVLTIGCLLCSITCIEYALNHVNANSTHMNYCIRNLYKSMLLGRNIDNAIKIIELLFQHKHLISDDNIDSLIVCIRHCCRLYHSGFNTLIKNIMCTLTNDQIKKVSSECWLEFL